MVGRCQASGRGWGTSLATKLWCSKESRLSSTRNSCPLSQGSGRDGAIIHLLPGVGTACGQTSGEGDTDTSSCRAHWLGMHPSILAAAPTLREDPDHRAWHHQHPLTRLLQKQPRKPATALAPSSPRPLAVLSQPPGSCTPGAGAGAIVGLRGSDCLAAPADGGTGPGQPARTQSAESIPWAR